MSARNDYSAWLTEFLPADYAAKRESYRFDHELRQRYQRAAFEAGWLVPRWPRELGGRGLGRHEAVEVRLESARRQAPKLPSIQSVGVVAPSIEHYGTPEHRDAYLVPTLRGDFTWALGMSEPDSGSDLAGLRTRAVADGDSFVVNGQKLWTTQAHTSDLLLLFCRTDPDAPRHRGISCLIVDLDTPGIGVRLIETGWPNTDEFCEVFLDDVVVPADRLLGERGGGWQVAMTALNHERDMIWVDNFAAVERGLERAAQAIADEGRQELEPELGRLATDAEALRLTGMRALEGSIEGRETPEFHILKLFGSETLQRTYELALAATGLSDQELLLDDYEALGATIYGGTSEIQRNIIGERVLGLPR